MATLTKPVSRNRVSPNSIPVDSIRRIDLGLFITHDSLMGIQYHGAPINDIGLNVPSRTRQRGRKQTLESRKPKRSAIWLSL